MKATFLYEGHEIVFHRGLAVAKLIIDGEEHDKQEGFVESQMSSFELHGRLDDGRKVNLQIKLGFLPDTAYLYIDDQLVESRKVI